MKKLLSYLLTFALVLALTMGLCSCDILFNNASDNDATEEPDNTTDTPGTDTGNTPDSEHTHSFTLKDSSDKYLKSAASCTDKAVYYYSCECGEKGTATFEAGEVLGHAPDTAADCTNAQICTVCRHVLIEALGHNYIDNLCSRCGIEKHSNGLEYVLSLDKTYYIVSGIGSCEDTDVIIPDKYNELSVKAIGSYAFYNCSCLTSITIGNGVTSIGNYAFRGYSSLTIYCEAESKPEGWDSNWNYSNCPVVWGATES